MRSLNLLFRPILVVLLINLNGCALTPAMQAVTGYFGSGGVTLYKKAEEKSTAKAEFVLVKFEIHHDMYTVTTSSPTPHEGVK